MRGRGVSRGERSNKGDDRPGESCGILSEA
jgi:hypothetical protein